jgi:hypothetical protein
MATPSLSIPQRDSLETTHVFLQGVRTFLTSITGPLSSDDRAMAEGLCLLSELCEKKIVEHFPDVRVWLKDWDVSAPKEGR